MLVHGRWFSPGTPASSTTKAGCHDIAEILLQVAWSTINQIKSYFIVFIFYSCFRTDIWHNIIYRIGSLYCTNDVSNPTPVYVLQGGDAVLQCGFESSSLYWDVHKGGNWDILADTGVTINNSKYSTSKNPSTGLYYRLHILNVGVSDIKQYKCSGFVNRKIQSFYLQLIFIGRCYYLLVTFKVGDIFFLVGSSKIPFEVRSLVLS